MSVRIVAEGLKFPEGPVWMPDGSVLVSEIAGGTVRRCLPDGSTRCVATLGGGPNGMALGPDGALYVCNNGGMKFTPVPSRGWLLPGDQPDDYVGGSIQRVDLATGHVTTLFTHCDGRIIRSPNDIVMDGAGGFWFTDHGKLRPRDRDRGGVYHASCDGSVIREVLQPLDSPNGIDLSPDGAELYVVESFTARVWAWPVLGPGQVAFRPHARVLGGRLIAGLGGFHMLDSMAVAPNGDICVATAGDHPGITVIAPDGSRIRHLPLPDPMPTNICFGGADGRTAFATLSLTGRLAQWDWED